MPEYIDFRGRKVEITFPLERIISLNPSITETLFLIGMGDSIKGVSAFCRRPQEAESVRKIGSYSTYNENIVDEISPELILTVSGYQDSLTEKLSSKYRIFQLELPSTPFGILDMVNRIGVVTEKIKESQELQRRMVKELFPLNIRKRAYLEIDLGGPVTFGSESYITSTLNFLGLETPYDSTPSEWLKPDYDLIAGFDPEIIFMEGKMFRGINKEDAINMLRNTPLRETSAFMNGHIFTTPGKLDFFAHHGPDFFFSVIPWLRSCLKSVNKEHINSK